MTTYNHLVFGSEADIVIANAEQRLDTGVALLPGRDYYIYLCIGPAENGAATADIKISLNATIPDGCTAQNSRKIGGFHTLCASVGTIGGHALTGYLAGDILPASFWDLGHRPSCQPEGMVYIKGLDLWVDIYLQSGTGANTKSIFGGSFTRSRNYMDFTDDLAAVGKTMLSDEEFQVVAEGSNQQTNIQGSANPGKTGGHVDTNSRRMISNDGVEDCCGVLWQWVQGGGWEYGNAGDYTGGWSENWPGDKGQVYRTSGRAGLLAGGAWSDGTSCGSRARLASYSRSLVSTYLGCRGRARSRVVR